MLILLERNLCEYRNTDSPTDSQIFAYNMNVEIIRLIRAYNSPEDTIEETPMDVVKDFFYEGDQDLLPIPVVSGTNPSNAHQFLTHIILSLGSYDTEIDALVHPSIRECLQYVGLIGDETNEESLKRYSAKLMDKYIREQVVYYPNSLTKAETL